MDEDRRIRFLVAPVLFVVSLGFGVWADPTCHLITRVTLTTTEWSTVIGLLAAGSVIVFVAGYIIGTLTYVFLRLAFKLRPRSWGRFHEVALGAALKPALDKLRADGNQSSGPELYVGVALDYSILAQEHEGVHRWLMRRWNAFSIAATSMTALVLSILTGYWVGIPISRMPEWWLSALVFWFALLATAIWAWLDTMRMLRFMATLPKASFDT